MQTQSHAQRLIEGLLTKVWLLKRQEVFGGRDSETLLPPLGLQGGGQEVGHDGYGDATRRGLTRPLHGTCGQGSQPVHAAHLLSSCPRPLQPSADALPSSPLHLTRLKGQEPAGVLSIQVSLPGAEKGSEQRSGGADERL